MNPMTPSTHIPQLLPRRPRWARAYKPDLQNLNDDDAILDEGDIDTVCLEVDASDRPTASLDTSSEQPALAAPYSDSQRSIRPSDAPVALRDIGPGSVLRGRYLIEKIIGVGGTSTVFSALDRHRYRARGDDEEGRVPGQGRIAVKALRSESASNDARVFRMEREFRQMQRLTHAGIVRVFDLDCEHDLWFITMELLEGQPLNRYLRTGIADAEAQRILIQCAEALAYAHGQGIVHGDLKPSNVFITQDGSVRLFDFGSAPDLDESSQEPASSHRFAATPPYASPETLEARGVEPRDDIFSLGCLAYELLSGGQHPFDRKSSLEARDQDLRPDYVDSIRPRHFSVISRALSWERADRPASAREFLQAFFAVDVRMATDTMVHVEWPMQRSALPALSSPPQARQFACDPGPATTELNAHTSASTITLTGPTSTDEITDGVMAPTQDFATATPRSTEIDFQGETAGNTSDAAIDSSGEHENPADETTHSAVESEDTFSASTIIRRASESVRSLHLDAGDPSEHNLDALASPLARPFAGFVPTEMLARSPRPEPLEALDLHVAGLSHSPWLKRTLLFALLALGLVAGLWLIGNQFPDGAAVPIELPAVSNAEAMDMGAMDAEPVPAPEIVPVAEEIPATPAPLPPVVRSAPGEVSFEAPTVSVSASQSMAVVNISRLKSTAGAAPILWSTVGESARPGVHYESVDNKLARFNDGQSVRTLYIPLKRDPAEASRPERSFVVKLQKAKGGPALGAITEARVILEGLE